MLRLERTCRTHHVPSESDFRSSLSCKDVRVNGIGEVEPSIQVLVRLEIEVIVLTPKFGVVVRFRQEPGVRSTMHGKPRDLKNSSQRSSAAFFVTP